MVTIRNNNDAYGMDVCFSAASIEEAVADMQATIRACGLDFADVVVCERDYDIIEDEDES